MDYYVLDTETTGFSPKTDAIIEIAAIKVQAGEITERFETFVNPGRPIPAKITELTGICDADVADAPDIETAAAELARFLSEPLPVIGHNIAFDLRFISAALARIGLNWNFRCIDTLDLARKAFPRMPNYKLNTLIDQLELSDCQQTHRAMDDVMVTRNLLLKCQKCLTSHGNKEFKSYQSPVFGAKANVEAVRDGVQLSPEEDAAVSAILSCCGDLASLIHMERRSQNYLTLAIPEDGLDFCRVKASPRTLWMSLDVWTGGFPLEDPRLAGVPNKNQRHWKISMSGIDEIANYADLIHSVAKSSLEFEGRYYEKVELEYLESIRSFLESAVESKGGPPDMISFRPTKADAKTGINGYTSVSFSNFTVCRVHIRGKKSYISVPVLFEDMVPDNFPVTRISSDNRYIRLMLDNTHPVEFYTDFLVRITGETVNRYPKTWDCCSRYMECSDAGKCVHPDKTFALECGYRKILASGRIFYGERRNVD